MSPKAELFSFTGLHRPVAFINCKSIYVHLYAVLRDWKFERIDAGDEQQAVITVQKTDLGYQRRSRWLSKPAIFRDPIDTVCDFIVDLVHAYLADNADSLCLHCAALEFEQGLVIFPNTYRAGKSILSLKLVSCGKRLFTDDVLPINAQDGAGIALGILPRLRLPLPENSGEKFINFLTERTGPRSERYLYVKLDNCEQAVLGTTALIRGITILERDSAAVPTLMRAPKNIVMKDVIFRNFARQNPAIEILDRLHSIVEQAECYTLRYATLDQAVTLLNEAFGLQASQGVVR